MIVLDVTDSTDIRPVGASDDGHVAVKVGDHVLRLTADAADRLDEALQGARAGQCALLT